MAPFQCFHWQVVGFSLLKIRRSNMATHWPLGLLRPIAASAALHWFFHDVFHALLVWFSLRGPTDCEKAALGTHWSVGLYCRLLHSPDLHSTPVVQFVWSKSKEAVHWTRLPTLRFKKLSLYTTFLAFNRAFARQRRRIIIGVSYFSNDTLPIRL